VDTLWRRPTLFRLTLNQRSCYSSRVTNRAADALKGGAGPSPAPTTVGHQPGYPGGRAALASRSDLSTCGRLFTGPGDRLHPPLLRSVFGLFRFEAGALMPPRAARIFSSVSTSRFWSKTEARASAIPLVFGGRAGGLTANPSRSPPFSNVLLLRGRRAAAARLHHCRPGPTGERPGGRSDCESPWARLPGRVYLWAGRSMPPAYISDGTSFAGRRDDRQRHPGPGWPKAGTWRGANIPQPLDGDFTPKRPGPRIPQWFGSGFAGCPELLPLLPGPRLLTSTLFAVSAPPALDDGPLDPGRLERA